MIDNTSAVGYWILGIVIVVAVIALGVWAFTANTTSNAGIPNTGADTSMPASSAPSSPGTSGASGGY